MVIKISNSWAPTFSIFFAGMVIWGATLLSLYSVG